MAEHVKIRVGHSSTVYAILLPRTLPYMVCVFVYVRIDSLLVGGKPVLKIILHDVKSIRVFIYLV